jgi:predicted nucleotidyltransferase component of viral defense system
MTTFPDRRYFGRVAEESGFRAGPLETVFRLAQLLGQIDERLGDELLLRGGTALNLFHLDLPRLSVDIDLDFVGAADAEQAQARRLELLAELEAVARSAGYEVAQERASYAMAHLRLNYVSADGLSAQLKVDLNFLDRVPVLVPARSPLGHPFGDDLPAIEIQTFALPELAAAKTIALVRRALARDLFDVAMLAELPGIDDELLCSLFAEPAIRHPRPSTTRTKSSTEYELLTGAPTSWHLRGVRLPSASRRRRSKPGASCVAQLTLWTAIASSCSDSGRASCARSSCPARWAIE